ncbi:MAG: tripartite tricarboxylate transporter substrate binding protein [Veillonellales bacterium]
MQQINTSPLVLAVKSDQVWQNVDDLIEYAKQHPRELKYGHGGVGTINHLVSVFFEQSAGINIQQVPFRGAGESITALLGGHVQLIFVNPMLVKEHVKSGTLRVLAVADEQRLIDPVFSDVPTLKKMGINVAINNWQAIAAQKNLPADVKAKLAAGLKVIVNDPKFTGRVHEKSLGLKIADSIYLISNEQR